MWARFAKASCCYGHLCVHRVCVTKEDVLQTFFVDPAYLCQEEHKPFCFGHQRFDTDGHSLTRILSHAFALKPVQHSLTATCAQTLNPKP